MVFLEFATAFGQPDVAPVGGAKVSSRNGYRPVMGEPVGSKTATDQAQYAGGQIGAVHPGQAAENGGC